MNWNQIYEPVAKNSKNYANGWYFVEYYYGLVQVNFIYIPQDYLTSTNSLCASELSLKNIITSHASI